MSDNQARGINHGKYIHGYTGHPLHKVWKNMKSRCYNVNVKQYKDYGGRGITICDEWISSAKCFIDWAVSNGWSSELFIDRKGNDEGYNPENCHFVTRAINNSNKRKYKNGSRFTGVNKHGGKYQAKIRVDNICHHIGTYFNEIDAAVARDSYIVSNSINRRLAFPQPITEIKL